LKAGSLEQELSLKNQAFKKPKKSTRKKAVGQGDRSVIEILLEISIADEVK
jgi:hypothetical protein